MTIEKGSQTLAGDALPSQILSEPVNQLILKAHSRCNLNCGYCYVYNLGDDSWRTQPRVMSKDTLQRVGYRIGEYIQTACEEPPVTMQITYHGGEPLLASADFYDEAVPMLRRAAGAQTVLRQTVQTNGTLLDDKYLDVFLRHAVGVGVSVDGSKEANDRHRLDHAGRSSYEAAVRGIERMQNSGRYRKLFRGILAVIDIENDPLETYESLRALEPPTLDFLLPHGNWATLPRGITLTEGVRSMQQHPYADWLKPIFDKWLEQDITYLRIRTFDSIIQSLSGGRSGVETVGGTQAGGMVVVETDGSYGLVDTLSSVPGKVNKTGLHVRRNSLAEANTFVARQASRLGALSLSEHCVSCPVVAQCGGGYMPHRYNKGTNFDNPSVYCPDLAATISHVHGALQAHILRKKIFQNVDAVADRRDAAL